MGFLKNKIVLLLCFTMLAAVPQAGAQRPVDEQHISVTMRMIGHQMLLETGDSTSRVLPIQIEGNTYRINFETSLGLEPDKLVQLVDSLVSNGNIAESYRVEIQDCDDKQVVYSFEMSRPGKKEIIPCRGRELPVSCYFMVFTILEHAPWITPGNSANSNKAFTSSAGYLPMAVSAALLMVITSVWFYFRKRPVSKVNNQLLTLGTYGFDTRNMALSLKGETTELTAKESDLLLLLYNFSNTTVKRETILNRVWGDEGDYIGRTLDVFISKLRKKLEADPALKIVNVRGVGYKLVVN